MQNFFKIGNIVVDVEACKILDSLNGKVINLDFTNMTIKLFETRTVLSPIRFNDKREILVWRATRGKWVPISSMYYDDVVNAIKKLIELNVENDLLG